MNNKSLAFALAVLGSTSAMAGGVLNPATTQPTVVFYVGGASAVATAVQTVVPSLFDTPSNVVTITQTAGEKAQGWFGVATINGTAQNLLVLYNKTNGEASGLNQLINTKGAANVGTSYVPGTGPGMAFDGKLLTIGPGGDSFSGTLGSCNLTTAPYTCTTSDTSHDAYNPISLVLNDVYPWEVVPLDDAGNPQYEPGKGGNQPAASLTTVTTGLQGYGVAVNPALYLALQKVQGLAPSSANAPVLGAAAQPNLYSVDYTSVVAELGAVKSAASLFANYQASNTDSTELTLVRRNASAGTQAASNIYFLNNVCGNNAIGGGLSTVGLGDANAPVFNVLELTTAGAVATALTGTTTSGYALGVLSFDNVDAVNSSTAWHFVKLDGVSPTYQLVGTTWQNDPTQRAAIANGSYKFATEISVSYLSNNSNATLATLQNQFIGGLQNSTLHNLPGIAYFDAQTQSSYTAVASQQARYQRGLGLQSQNNCAPLADISY